MNGLESLIKTIRSMYKKSDFSLLTCNVCNNEAGTHYAVDFTACDNSKFIIGDRCFKRLKD